MWVFGLGGERGKGERGRGLVLLQLLFEGGFSMLCLDYWGGNSVRDSVACWLLDILLGGRPP